VKGGIPPALPPRHLVKPLDDTPSPLHSAIEFLRKHLTPKPLRRPHPSASLFMDTVSPHPALAASLQSRLALPRNRIV
jgi:hypothetical protein